MGFVFNCVVEENLNVADVIVDVAISDNPIIEELGLNEDLSLSSVYSVLLDDAVLFQDESITAQTLSYTISLDTNQLFPTVHSYPFFNSFIELDDNIYGANENGIYKLAGDTDDGEEIHTGIVWSKTSFGASNKKRFRAGFIDGDIENTQLQMTGDVGVGLYPVLRNKFNIGRDVYGRDWEVRLADFTRIDSFELIPVIFKR